MSERQVDPRYRERLMRVAIELAEREANQQQKTTEERLLKEALSEALSEVGVEARFLEQAALELERREAESAQKAAARRERAIRTATLAASALGAVALISALGWWLLSPPAPWVQPMDSPAGWSLEVNPGTKAALSFAAEEGRGQVAVVRVDQFALDAQGQYRANLDGLGVPSSLRGYETLSLDIAGTLPTARVYLEAGPDERWRSPPISVSSEWTRQQLPLAAFEHQVRKGGRWQTAGREAPSGLTQLSVKVGHFMNAPDAVGELRVDAISLE